jgi:hypothetical protein
MAFFESVALVLPPVDGDALVLGESSSGHEVVLFLLCFSEKTYLCATRYGGENPDL